VGVGEGSDLQAAKAMKKPTPGRTCEGTTPRGKTVNPIVGGEDLEKKENNDKKNFKPRREGGETKTGQKKISG